MPGTTNVRSTIGPVIQDLVSNFLFYDRREDDVLPVGAIEEAVRSGEITVDTIVDLFREEVSRRCQSHREASSVDLSATPSQVPGGNLGGQSLCSACCVSDFSYGLSAEEVTEKQSSSGDNT